MSDEGDLFATSDALVSTERCVRPRQPHVKAMFDPHPLDSERVLRNKWNFRLMAMYYGPPCLTGGPDCPRCLARYHAQWNKPEWPWVK